MSAERKILDPKKKYKTNSYKKGKKRTDLNRVSTAPGIQDPEFNKAEHKGRGTAS